MHRIYSALIEIAAACVFILPLFCLYGKFIFHSVKRTLLYIAFGFYLVAALALVGFPDITSLGIDTAINIIPFVDMPGDFANACLNVLLFIPFGIFLPVLWDKFRSCKRMRGCVFLEALCFLPALGNDIVKGRRAIGLS